MGYSRCSLTVRSWDLNGGLEGVDHRAYEAKQLEQVVAGADEGPLALDLLQSPQQELAEAPALLDLAEDRLHRHHA